MPARSLKDMCQRTCMKHLGEIYSFGDLPYHLVRPILFKINKAEQLREVEMSSTYIEGETEELWRRLIGREFPNWERKNYVPKNPKLWYKVYEKYKREEAQEIAEAEAKLAGAFGALKSEADQQKSKLVSQRLMPRLPKEGRLAGWRRDVGRDVPDHLSWGGGSRTKSVVKKAMREAREAANRRTLSTPTGQLRIPEGQIRKAPQALINDYRVKQQPSVLVRPPRAKPRTEAQMAEDAARREQERRLLNIKTPSSSRPEQVVSDSEDDDDADEKNGGGGYLDDLFSDEEDEDEAPPPVRKPTRRPAKPSPATAPTKPSGSNILSNRPKTLLSSTAQRRVLQSATRPIRAEPAPSRPQQVAQQASPIPRPHRPPPTAASPPPGRTHAGPSSPPPKPTSSQPRQAGSPPPAGLLRKRKPPTDIFMRKKPRT